MSMKLNYKWSRQASRKDSTRWGVGTTDKCAQKLLNAYLLDRIQAGMMAHEEQRFALQDNSSAQEILLADAPRQQEILRAALHCLKWSVANKRFLPGLNPLLDHLLAAHPAAEAATGLWESFTDTHLWLYASYGMEVSVLLSLAETQIAQRTDPPALRTFLGWLRQIGPTFRYSYGEPHNQAIVDKVSTLLAHYETFLPGSGEAWSEAAMDAIAGMEPAQQSAWETLFAHLATADKSRPTLGWLKTAGKRMDAVGRDAFRTQAANWLMKMHPSHTYPLYPELIAPTRGLLWCCGLEADAGLARAVGRAADCYFVRVPDIGPRNVSVGNAALLALGQMNHFEAIAQLTRLRHAIKYNHAQTQINKSLSAAAKTANLCPEELEEIGVPTGGMDAQGCLHLSLDGCHIMVQITGRTEPAWTYLLPDDSVSSEPNEAQNAVLKAHADTWKAFGQQVTAAADLLAVQRDRLEALLMSSREWDWQTWNERYACQPLLSDMVGRLIWQFETDAETVLAMRQAGAWVDAQGAPVVLLQSPNVEKRDAEEKQAAIRVRLWHPALSDAPTVLTWRRYVDLQQITQPFAQAHREIYLLTEAEKQTAAHSNRFAAQVMRHYHFDKQVEQRCWKYDSSVHELRILRLLPQHGASGIRVEWDLAHTNDEGLFMEAVPISLVTSGSARFRDSQGVIHLADVPPRIYSEMMREIGLLASASAIGENPLWREGGVSQSAAGKPLSDPVQSRHQTLASLLPRLNRADRLSLETKSLVVRGDWHTYYIDLATAAVAMGAERRYVCIQPRNTPLSPQERGSVLLPYEGDPTLAVILSKAFLLCKDSATTDQVILAQIHPQNVKRRGLV